jgi:hypothetical protein
MAVSLGKRGRQIPLHLLEVGRSAPNMARRPVAASEQITIVSG